MNTYHPLCLNHRASLPQNLLAALNQLQAQTTDILMQSVYVYDLVEQRILCTSGSVASMLGYTATTIDALGTIGLASLIHPDDLNSVSEHYQRFTTLQSGKVITLNYRMQRADGSWSFLRSQETPLVMAIEGFPLHIVGIVQDITQVLQPTLEDLLGRANASDDVN